MSTTAVSFRNVTKTFGAGPDAIHALDDITFDVPAGSVYGVVGTSGAGKSTLLRTANGLESATSGTVHVLGEEPATLSQSGLRGLRRQVGMVFQHYNLVGSRTVSDNVAMPLVLAKTPKADINRRVSEALELVGLAGRGDHRPAQLSGGQRQRVGIARALVTNPKVLLCDEPTSALDPLTTSQILELLVRINEQLGLTILIITHQMDVIARIANEVAVLEGGRLIEHGGVDKIFSHPQQPLTRRFVETVVPQRLPDSLSHEIQHGHANTIIRIVHTDGAARHIIGEINKLYGVSVSLLHATDAPLRHTTVGTLVLGLQGESRAISDALAWLNTHEGLTVEVLP